MEDFEHPEGRRLSKDIKPSAPPGGMRQNKGSRAHRTALEPHTWPKEVSAERFAELLAHYLDEALGTNAFDALVLAAPPHFLGILHEALAKQIAKRVKATVDKDLVMLDSAEIRDRLIDAVFPSEPAGAKK